MVIIVTIVTVVIIAIIAIIVTIVIIVIILGASSRCQAEEENLQQQLQSLLQASHFCQQDFWHVGCPEQKEPHKGNPVVEPYRALKGPPCVDLAQKDPH